MKSDSHPEESDTESRMSTVSSIPQSDAGGNNYLFELQIDGSSAGDDKSMFSAISTPVALEPDDTSSTGDQRLNLYSLGLIGRDAEHTKLAQAFDSLVHKKPLPQAGATEASATISNEPCSQQQRRVVMISGTSGTGKTKLAETIKEAAVQQGGVFVRGKFALNMTNQPYSGIANACAELCGAILDLRMKNPEKYKTVVDGIIDAVDAELALLVQVIPVLEEIVDFPMITTTLSGSGDASTSSDAKNQILYAFCRFFRVIARTLSPLILTLDDLQWADSSSFDLFEAMMIDEEISRTMLIGIYRSNEVISSPRLSSFLDLLEKKDTGFIVSQIDLRNLDIDAVHGIIAHILGCKEDQRTLRLAQVCHTKTLGNPFFLLQFISLLRQKNLLQLTRVKHTWVWDIDVIEASTSASDNVVDLLKERMAELPSHLSGMLSVAACLGATFEKGTLRVGMTKAIEREIEFENALQRLQTKGFFVKVSSFPPRFSFVHDKIHEAAADLIPSETRSQYRRSLGEALLENLDDGRLSSEIFVVVNLLNDIESQLLTYKSRLSLAELNHRASERAATVSAFDSAARYAGSGIELLGGDILSKATFKLSLSLYAIGARAEGALGNVERLEKYCMAVIGRDDIRLEDKFDAYKTWVEHLLGRDPSEAANLILDILSRVDCRFPTNPTAINLGVKKHLVTIKATMKTRRPLTLHTMTDKKQLQIMHWLDKLFLGFYLCNDDRMPLVFFRSLNLTMKHGISIYSAPAFATVALALVGIANDIQGAAVYGQHAVDLLAKSESKALHSRTLFIVNSFVFPWTRPLRDTFDLLMEGYDIGHKTGDIENMSWAAVNWLQLKLYSGSPLQELESNFQSLLSQMQSLKMQMAYKFMQPVYQAVLNLSGHDNLEDPTSLVGIALSETELNEGLNDVFFKPSMCIHQCLLLAYFGDHIKHAELVCQMGTDYVAQALLAAPENMINTFINGLSCFAAAGETQEKKYMSLGQVCREKIKKWASQGCPNVQHYALFLDAEYYVLKGKHAAAVKNYKAAIDHAVQNDFIQDAALASERLGEFYLSIAKDTKEAFSHFRKAASAWLSWGAARKVRYLLDKYPDAFVLAEEEVLFCLDRQQTEREPKHHGLGH